MEMRSIWSTKNTSLTQEVSTEIRKRKLQGRVGEQERLRGKQGT